MLPRVATLMPPLSPLTSTSPAFPISGSRAGPISRIDRAPPRAARRHEAGRRGEVSDRLPQALVDRSVSARDGPIPAGPTDPASRLLALFTVSSRRASVAERDVASSRKVVTEDRDPIRQRSLRADRLTTSYPDLRSAKSRARLAAMTSPLSGSLRTPRPEPPGAAPSRVPGRRTPRVPARRPTGDRGAPLSLG